MRLHVPLKSYNGDPISIPDDIPLRDNPISITTQLATLEPIRSAIQEMAKENETKRQKRIQKCSKILEYELGNHFIHKSERPSIRPIRHRLKLMFFRNRKIKVGNDINIGWINRNISRNRVFDRPRQFVPTKSENSSWCRNLRVAFIRTRRWSNWWRRFRSRIRSECLFYTAANANTDITTIAVTNTSSQDAFSSNDFTKCKCSSVQANYEENATPETKYYKRHSISPSCTLCSFLLVPLTSPFKQKIKKPTKFSYVSLPIVSAQIFLFEMRKGKLGSY